MKLASSVGWTQSSLAKFETGEDGASIDRLILLADFFDVSTDYLLGRTISRK